jgi:hypothetical protein
MLRIRRNSIPVCAFHTAQRISQVKEFQYWGCNEVQHTTHPTGKGAFLKFFR